MPHSTGRETFGSLGLSHAVTTTKIATSIFSSISMHAGGCLISPNFVTHSRSCSVNEWMSPRSNCSDPRSPRPPQRRLCHCEVGPGPAARHPRLR